MNNTAYLCPCTGPRCSYFASCNRALAFGSFSLSFSDSCPWRSGFCRNNHQSTTIFRLRTWLFSGCFEEGISAIRRDSPDPFIDQNWYSRLTAGSGFSRVHWIWPTERFWEWDSYLFFVGLRLAGFWFGFKEVGGRGCCRPWEHPAGFVGMIDQPKSLERFPSKAGNFCYL